MVFVIAGLCLVAGAAIGLVGGLMGIGGGLIAIPALGLAFGMPQQMAQGTSLILVLPTILMAVRKYNQNSRIDWVVAGFGASAAIVFTWFGARLALGVDPALLRRSFAIFLCGVGMFYLWQTYRFRRATKNSKEPSPARQLTRVHGALLGALGGTLGGFFGVGGAILIVPIVTTLFRYSQANAQALALTMIIPGSTIALVTYTWAGQADWLIGVPMALGSLLCVNLGVRLAYSLPERRLRACFAGLIFLTVIVLFFEG